MAAAAIVYGLLSAALPEAVSAGPAEAIDQPSAARWARVSFGADIRFEANALLKRYTIHGRGVWFSGAGPGAGFSLSLHFRTPASVGLGGGARWIEFELGAGEAAHYDTWNGGPGLWTAFIENETSVIAGAHLASGTWAAPQSGSRWSGVLFGVAWVPTYVHFFGNGDFASGGKLNPAGLRLTVDWGRVAQSSVGGTPPMRVFFTWLPYVGNVPTGLTAGAGWVFY